MVPPDLWSKQYKSEGNIGQELLVTDFDGFTTEVDGDALKITNGKTSYTIVQPNAEAPAEDKPFLRLASSADSLETLDLSGSDWENLPDIANADEVLRKLHVEHLTEEDAGKSGLRLPQIGAIYSVLGQLTLESPKPSTVVLPTGTGKTDTMITVYAHGKIKKLLVIVPSVALREQIAVQFSTTGVLRKLKIIDTEQPNPVVGKMYHAFQTKLGAKGFVEACNVIIATPDVINGTAEDIRSEFLSGFSHLFVDEAHHIAAKTWKEVKVAFMGKPVVQFTATPYRNDGQKLEGKIIYNFPLRLAQKQKYFSKIKYIGVIDFDSPDKAIAEKAVAQLKDDLDRNLDHLVMARVNTIGKADKLVQLYQELAPEFNPVVLHSDSDDKQRKLDDLENSRSRIVVCVDMLGEGYDLPKLKIAAIHVPHKSLGVTLQFIGRFARTGSPDIGDATFIVNQTDPLNNEKLKELYAQDNDWNYILQSVAGGAIEEEESTDEFQQGFTATPEGFSVEDVAPKMSAVVYRSSSASWHPERLQGHFSGDLITNPVPINHSENVAFTITRKLAAPSWSDSFAFEEVQYELNAFYFDPTKKLLYINGSSNDGVYKELAKLLCGEDVVLMEGDTSFRPLATLRRRVATTVGVHDALNRDNSYQMNAGANVEFTPAATRNKINSNMFANGYDPNSAKHVTLGASKKGRIWSSKGTIDLRDWMRWCDYVGEKVIDESISMDDIRGSFMQPQQILTRPTIIPLLLEWPTEFYMTISESVYVEMNGVQCPFKDAELRITDFKSSGNIPFILRTAEWEAKFEIELVDNEMKFHSVGNMPLYVNRKGSIPFTEYLAKDGLNIICEKQIVITPEMKMYSPNSAAQSYDARKLQTIDWGSTNIQVESRGSERKPDSIQTKAIEYVDGLDDWDLIIDDDGPGEAADVVALKVSGARLVVNLIHCKFSSSASPGHRVKDLYEVCGQAIKSVDKMRNPDLLLRNLIRRERNRRPALNNVIKGDENSLLAILDKVHTLIPDFTITIVQPGVKKVGITAPLLELLAATEVYISDTGGGTKLSVIVSS